MRQRLRYVYEDVDRHGNVRIYFRRPGHPIVRIREPVDSAAFLTVYASLLEQPAPAPQPTGGTLAGLVRAYCASPAFRRLDQRTQRVRRGILEHCLEEPIAPGAAETFAAFPLARLTAKAVRVLRDRKHGAPQAGNGRVKALRQALAWALDDGMPGLAGNPARDVPYLPGRAGGWHSWTAEEVAAYEARHPTGSMARLALDLLLYTGARRSDVIRLGRPHRRDGWLRWTAHKGRARSPQVIEIPVLPELARSIAATATGDLTYLVSETGRPFGHAYFGNWFSRRCAEAGLSGCSAHGLRKAGAARAAEAGATDHQLMAIFGWTSICEAQRYTRAADRRRMAAAATRLLASPAPSAGEPAGAHLHTSRRSVKD